jgi:hypothetical protein
MTTGTANPGDAACTEKTSRGSNEPGTDQGRQDEGFAVIMPDAWVALMLSLWLNGLVGGVLFSLVDGLVGLGLTIICREMRVVNFAHLCGELLNNTEVSEPILACSRLPGRTGVSDGK